MSAEPAQRIGPYRLVERIGGGGFSTVWKAQGDGEDRTVALKVPSNDDAVPVLEQEAAILGQLDHPNIVQLLEAPDPTDAPPHMVLELVPGTTLRERLKEGPLPTGEARKIFDMLVAGLAHAHERDVAHRDLKPENVLLTDEGRPLLTDFGLADTTGGPEGLALSGTFETQIRGTVAYMAPEQRRGEKGGLRADVYTLGLVLFEMLAGHLPEPGDELSQTRQDVPDVLNRVFQRCFCRYDDRFPSAIAIRTFLEEPTESYDEEKPSADPETSARKGDARPASQTSDRYGDVPNGKGLTDKENVERFQKQRRENRRRQLSAILKVGMVYLPLLAGTCLLCFLVWKPSLALNRFGVMGGSLSAIAFLIGGFWAVYEHRPPRCPNCGNRRRDVRQAICRHCRRRLR